MNKLAIPIFALLWCGSAHAADGAADPGICYIYVASTAPACHGAMIAGADAAMYYKVNTWFRDTEVLGNMNAGRCLERAQEYKNWCQIAGAKGPVGGADHPSSVSHVYAFYQVAGINRIGSYAYTDDKTYLHDTIARNLRWHD